MGEDPPPGLNSNRSTGAGMPAFHTIFASFTLGQFPANGIGHLIGKGRHEFLDILTEAVRAKNFVPVVKHQSLKCSVAFFAFIFIKRHFLYPIALS